MGCLLLVPGREPPPTSLWTLALEPFMELEDDLLIAIEITSFCVSNTDSAKPAEFCNCANQFDREIGEESYVKHVVH